MTKIYSVFPGMGKSSIFNKSQLNDKKLKIADSDSSVFSWVVDPDNGTKMRNPEFPHNYIKHIKSLIGKADYIFVSTHKEVIKELMYQGIEFDIIYPARHLKSNYIGRYEARNSPPEFINLLDKMWDTFIDDIESCGHFRLLRVNKDVYLEDVIKIELPRGKSVFLGGTCNNSKWRNEFENKLTINYFNPVVEDWTPQLKEIEDNMKKFCDYEVYVITPRMTGVYSIAEAVDCANQTPERTIFVILEQDDGKTFNTGQMKSLQAVADLIQLRGGKVAYSLQDAINYLNRQ